MTSFRPGDGGNWKPIAGDRTHKGFDTLGLFDAETGTFFLVNSIHDGEADISFTFCARGHTPVTGDHGSGRSIQGIAVPGR
ncbi:hypothetical protein [Kitasatospora purpeofusca]|uniref:hypothetical protein n=1 Tax=Kitasatospora purpeofusca TaxID=67352 RepID=UPI0036543570